VICFNSPALKKIQHKEACMALFQKRPAEVDNLTIGVEAFQMVIEASFDNPEGVLYAVVSADAVVVRHCGERCNVIVPLLGKAADPEVAIQLARDLAIGMIESQELQYLQ
jgi:hypothetical protein